MSGERSPLRKISANEQQSPAVSKRLKLSVNIQSSLVETVIEYPKQVGIPSKSLVFSLYEQAMTTEGSDQMELAEAGLLSLEQVLLPAAAYQEDEALKKVQAVVQRDHPDKVDSIVACRKAVYDCVGAAMTAVVSAREARRPAELAYLESVEEAKQTALQHEKLLTERMAEQIEQMAAMERAKRLREAVKKLPRNQELWREVVYLMTEMSKLQKEERLWKESAERLARRAQEVAEQHDTAVVDDDMHEEDVAQVDPDMDKVTQTVDDITISSVRINKALQIVSNIAIESDRVRKELYHRYRRDHQFHGYQGVKDPKGLLRALSQSQDVE
jgi:hypothetical protein